MVLKMAWMLKKYCFAAAYLAVVIACVVGIKLSSSYSKQKSYLKPVFSCSYEPSAPAETEVNGLFSFRPPAYPAPPLCDDRTGAGGSPDDSGMSSDDGGKPLVAAGDILEVIHNAAHRNHCSGDSFYLLLAIRRAENGGVGRQFGIEHGRCDAIMKQRPYDTLDIQAGWAAASVVKAHGRYIDAGFDGVIGDEFIEYMASRYCPPIGDGSNHENWKRNVKFWFKKIKRSAISNQLLEVASK